MSLYVTIERFWEMIAVHKSVSKILCSIIHLFVMTEMTQRLLQQTIDKLRELGFLVECIKSFVYVFFLNTIKEVIVCSHYIYFKMNVSLHNV